MSGLRALLVGAAVGVLLGFVAGWGLYHRPAPPVAADQPHGPQQTPAGLLVAERPAASLPQPQGLPKGSRVVRAVHLEVLSSTPGPSAPLPAVDEGQALPDGYAAKPVRVDLSLVRQPDGHLRVLASSPDGEILEKNSIDIPDASAPVVAPAPSATKERGWSAGGFWNPSTRAWGPVVTKDLGPFRLGAEVRFERLAVAGTTVSNNSVDLSFAVHF